MRRHSPGFGRKPSAYAAPSARARRAWLALFAGAVALALLVGTALAAAGDLDSSFGSGGKVLTGIGRYGDDEARAVAVQGDGKVVAVGRSGRDFAVVRYNPNGTLDTSFSGDGKATTSFGVVSRADAVAIQANGAILVAGKVGVTGLGGEAPGNWGLARLNPNGTPDTTFDGDGKLKTDFGGGGATDIAVFNGKIIAGGGANADDGPSDFGVARYNGNGSLDPTFGGDGKVTTNFGIGFDDYVDGVAIQPNGKIVAAGTAGNAFAAARYNAGGALDSTFNGDGKVRTAFGADPAHAHDVAIQGNGAIVLAGDHNDDGFAVARYDSSGIPDSSFSGDGKQTTDFGGAAMGRSVAIQGNGAIVVAGSAEAQPNNEFANNFAVVRYDTSGILDPSFSDDGKQTTSFGGNDSGNGVAIHSGQIVVAGSSTITGVDPGTTASDFVLARYQAGGDLDPGFGNGGKVNTVIGDDFALNARAVAIQADGRIVVAGDSIDEPGIDDRDATLARYLTNGSLDTTFHGSGKLTTDLSAAGLDDLASGVAIQQNNAIVIAGGTATNTVQRRQSVVARFTPTGNPDSTFSGDGKVTFGFTAGEDDGANDVVVQGNGAILVGGGIGDSGRTGLARFDSNGNPDTTFGGGDGVTVSDLANGASAIALQSNGKIVASTPDTGHEELGVMRFTSVGSPDTTFSGDGLATAPFPGRFVHGFDVAINPNSGSIVTAGTLTDVDAPFPPCGGTPGTDIAVARFTSGGNLDSNFSGNGRTFADFGGGPDFGNSVAVQPDGSTVVAGGAGDNFALVRYKPNGNPDANFSGDGRLTTNFGGCDQASAVALPGSKILAVGTSAPTDATPGAGLAGRFALARYFR